MDFKEFRQSKRTEKNKSKNVIESDIVDILENLDQELNVIDSNQDFSVDSIANKTSIENFKPRFLGKLYESPNPLEYPEGTMYKNTRNGVVYIKEGETWEYLVEDGKNGSVGPQGVAGAAGSGVGVDEVKNIVNNMTIPSTLQTGTTLTFDPVQSIYVLDPRKGKGINCTVVKNNSTSAIDLTYTNELLVIGTNSTSATNAVNVLLFDNLITQSVMTSGSPLSTSARSFPHLTNKSVNISTQTNSTALVVTLGE